MRERPLLSILAALLLLGAACQPSASAHAEGDGHDHAAEGHHDHDHDHEEHGDEEGGPIRLSEEAIRIAGIRTEVVSARPVQATLDVPGTVAPTPSGRVEVTPPVAGRVVRLLVAAGDRVARGQTLAVLRSPDLAEASAAVAEAETRAAGAQADVRSAEAEIALARSRQRAAEGALERQRRFARAGAFSGPALQVARNELDEAETERASARNDLAAARVRRDRAERLLKEGLVSRAEAEDARLAVEQGEVRLERAEGRVTLARQGYERERRIGGSGLVNAREVGAAEAEARAAAYEVQRQRVRASGARSAQEGARRAVQDARARLASLRGGAPGTGDTVALTSPIAGVVAERNVTLGQAVERSTDLFDVEDLGQVDVTANVPEADLARVRTGAVASVTANAAPGRAFTGRVVTIGARLDPRTRTLPVQVRVTNSDGRLRPGGFARVSLATGAGGAALSVPATAVMGEETSPVVYVREGDGYEKRPVQLGRRAGERIEVRAGLRAGDEVVTQGGFVLQSEERKGELQGHEH